jgi:hypothetical protein
MPAARISTEKAHQLIAEGLQLKGNSKGRAIDLIWLLLPKEDLARTEWVQKYGERLYELLGFDQEDIQRDSSPPWKDEWLQKRLVTALGRIGSKEAIPHLEQFAQNVTQRPRPERPTAQRKRNELQYSIRRAIEDLKPRR